MLIERDFSALPVVDGADLVGIVTEADLMLLESPDPRTRLRTGASMGPKPVFVADVMSRGVITVDADADLATAAELMIRAAIKHLPVLNRGRLVGILSRHDIVRVIAAPDARMEDAVKDRLLGEGSGLACLGVRVERGLVELTGAGDMVSRRLADSLARSVPGVIDVRFVDKRS